MSKSALVALATQLGKNTKPSMRKHELSALIYGDLPPEGTNASPSKDDMGGLATMSLAALKKLCLSMGLRTLGSKTQDEILRHLHGKSVATASIELAQSSSAPKDADDFVHALVAFNVAQERARGTSFLNLELYDVVGSTYIAGRIVKKIKNMYKVVMCTRCKDGSLQLCIRSYGCIPSSRRSAHWSTSMKRPEGVCRTRRCA